MKNNTYINTVKKWILFAAVALTITSCDAFLEADPPTGSLTSDNVFTSDGTATSAVVGIYAQMMASSEPHYPLNGGMGVFGGLSADELSDETMVYTPYQLNQILPVDNWAVTYMWSECYKYIYQANACIIGMTDNTNLTEAARKQLLGEVYFLRALNYFYLTNLYGAVPIVTGTDYRENMSRPRSSSTDVYAFIEEDLITAETLLGMNYPSDDRARINKNVVRAMMARTSLYLNKYQAAKEKATEVIDAGYQLAPIDQVFKKTSTETIWQLASVSNFLMNTNDANFYDPYNAGRATYIIVDDLYNSFETGDSRKDNWIREYDFNGSIVHYPAKYTQIYEPDPTEYNIMFRLAEQYLIRAEAEANLNDLDNAITDLNKIRARANLGNYTGAVTKEAILSTVAHERRVEFFAEQGHRWFDLKRTNMTDAVLGALKPTWKTTAKLWPVPQREINSNKNLLPNNQGY